MPRRTEHRFALQRAGAGEAAEVSRAAGDPLDRQVHAAISPRCRAAETSVLQQNLEAMEPEIRRIRADLLHAQQEIEQLKAAADPQYGAEPAMADAILVFISEHQNPSNRRIAGRFGLSEEEGRSILSEAQRSGLVSSLNLLNGGQRWILTKKGTRYLEDRNLLKQTFRKRAPSRVYW